MLFLYNPQDYVMGTAHYIDKDKGYILKDRTNGREKQIKGSSLLSRLYRERKSGGYTIENVNYGCKPFVYMDVPYEPACRLSYDLSSGKVENTTDMPWEAERPFNDLIILKSGALCLDFFMRMKSGLFEDNLEIVALSGLISVSVPKDYTFCKVILNNVEHKGCVLFFELILDIESETNQNHPYRYDIKYSLKSGICESNTGDRARLFTYPQLINNILSKDYTFSNELLFKGDSIFSNYHEGKLEYDGRVYGSSEAAYQSMKTNDLDLRNKFTTLSPDDAKKLGRKIEKTNKFRTDWDNARLSVMQGIVRERLRQDKIFAKALSRTSGRLLVEDTTGWCDQYWGRCNCPVCRGRGQNMLGRTLTRLRKDTFGD